MQGLKRAASTAATVGMLACLSVLAQAQSISFTNDRGQVIDSNNPFPLDRVSRGEGVTVHVSSPNYPVYTYITSDKGFYMDRYDGSAFAWRFIVPRDTAFDNCIVHAVNCVTGREVRKRLPIGTK